MKLWNNTNMLYKLKEKKKYLAFAGAGITLAAFLAVISAGGIFRNSPTREADANIASPSAAGIMSATAALATASSASSSEVLPSATSSDAEIVLQPDVLELAAVGTDGERTEEPADSMAAHLYDMLASLDSRWISAVYRLYESTPSAAAAGLGDLVLSADLSAEGLEKFTGFQVQYRDSCGQLIQGVSNTRAIVSMLNVLYTRKFTVSWEELENLALELWAQSHNWQAQIGDVYYCEGGCSADEEAAEPVLASVSEATVQSETAAEPELTEESETASPDLSIPDPDGGPGVVEASSQIQAATSSQAADLSQSTVLSQTATPSQLSTEPLEACPGHRNLIVTLSIKGIEDSGLFSVDLTPYFKFSETWSGWDEEAVSSVEILLSQDWYQEYGLYALDLVSVNPLTSQEIDLYMELLPPECGELRREAVRWALSSVGRVPYYWGGKPRYPGYEGNEFGTVIQPDIDGRFLKGLDCSGWINWVYWSVTGSSLVAESTGTLVSAGEPLNKEELLPGDICIRTGPMAHTVIFLGWAPDGRMLCIQETSGLTNNVEVSLSDEDWPCYRRILP